MYVLYDEIQSENINTEIFKSYYVSLSELQTNFSGF